MDSLCWGGYTQINLKFTGVHSAFQTLPQTRTLLLTGQPLHVPSTPRRRFKKTRFPAIKAFIFKRRAVLRNFGIGNGSYRFLLTWKKNLLRCSLHKQLGNLHHDLVWRLAGWKRESGRNGRLLSLRVVGKLRDGIQPHGDSRSVRLKKFQESALLPSTDHGGKGAQESRFELLSAGPWLPATLRWSSRNQ